MPRSADLHEREHTVYLGLHCLLHHARRCRLVEKVLHTFVRTRRNAASDAEDGVLALLSKHCIDDT